MSGRFESILAWYSGKARDTIVSYTVPTLVECEQIGYWKKGASRKVRATLNKQNVAASWARKVEKEFGEVQFGWRSLRYGHPLQDAQANLLLGSFERAPQLRATLATKLFSDAERPYADDAIRWAEAFAPVADLVALLDSRRPARVVVMRTLSPTVAKNVGESIGLDLATIQSPPMHGEWVEFVYKGQPCRVYQVVVDWPEGTLHDRSRFVHSANHEQCQACGHAIKNAFNWVPILAYDARGVPHSLWVGRDCAGKLFGCEVEGDAIYAGRR